MVTPKFRVACCLCGKPVSLASDVYALDAEWQRRFPDMTGTLGCQRCAVNRNYWRCERPDGTFVAGHRPATRRPGVGSDFDSWCHIEAWGTHVAMVTRYPWSSLQQGAEDYLRHTAGRRGLDLEFVRQIQDALDRWDTLRATTSAGVAGVAPPAPGPAPGPAGRGAQP